MGQRAMGQKEVMTGEFLWKPCVSQDVMALQLRSRGEILTGGMQYGGTAFSVFQWINPWLASTAGAGAPLLGATNQTP